VKRAENMVILGVSSPRDYVDGFPKTTLGVMRYGARRGNECCVVVSHDNVLPPSAAVKSGSRADCVTSIN